MALCHIGPVVGEAVCCGPCALSSVTGLPTDTWPDAPMAEDEVTQYAEKHGGVRVRSAFGQPLKYFSIPEFYRQQADAGAYLVFAFKSRHAHLIAVSIAERPAVVDNVLRSPMALRPLPAHLRRYMVEAAWRLPAVGAFTF